MNFDTGKKLLLCMGIAILGFLFIIFGSSYALLDSTNRQNISITNNLQIKYNEKNSSAGDIIYLNVPYPVSDKEALESKPYVFSITNVSNALEDFDIFILNDEAMASLEDCNDCFLDDKNIKIAINKSTPKLLSDFSNGLILSDALGPHQTKTYELILWLDEYSDNSVFEKHFFKRLSVQ